jgi:hypothetical protein
MEREEPRLEAAGAVWRSCPGGGATWPRADSSEQEINVG